MVYRAIVANPAGPTLSRKDIQDFEERWGGKLPSDYRDWLMYSNGGIPEAHVIQTMREDVFVSSFLYLDPSSERGIDSESRRLRGSKAMLPVALEGSGGLIVISTLTGQILLLEDESDLAGTEIAKSWQEFEQKFVEVKSVLSGEDARLDQMVRDADPALLDQYLSSGGDISRRHTSGETMLQLAVIKKRKDTLELLLSRGATLQGALHVAANMGSIPMIEALLANGASMDERNEKGQLPEEVAASPFIRKYLQGKKV